MKKQRYANVHEVVCDLCGKKIKARGLKAHLRIAHDRSLTVVTQVKQDPVVTPVRKDLIVVTEVSETKRIYSPWHELMSEMASERIESGRKQIRNMKEFYKTHYGSEKDFNLFLERLQQQFRPNEWIKVTSAGNVRFET